MSLVVSLYYDPLAVVDHIPPDSRETLNRLQRLIAFFSVQAPSTSLRQIPSARRSIRTVLSAVRRSSGERDYRTRNTLAGAAI
jgi:hypothetical protein